LPSLSLSIESNGISRVVMKTGPNDKYTTMMVQDRLRRVLDEMDIFDDEYTDVLNASMVFTDGELHQALTKLKQSQNSKLNTVASELLTNWQPEETALVTKNTGRPLPKPPGLPPLVNPPPLPVQLTWIERFGKLQNMILQSMEGDSDFAKWMPTSKHESSVQSFGDKLRQALPRDPKQYASFVSALRNLDVNNGVMFYNLMDTNSFKAVKQLYLDNLPFLEELNRDFQNRQTAKIPGGLPPLDNPPPLPSIPHKAHDDLMKKMGEVTPESVEDEDILDMIEDAFSQEQKAAVSEKKTASGTNKLVIGNMLDNPEKNILVDPANEKTMNGNGGVSGAIKAMYETKNLLKSYVKDLLKFPKVDGKRCINGEVKHTFTGGIDVIHISAPDLREKKNRTEGSKTEPNEEAKEKLFQAYYNAFRMANNLNSNESKPKPISTPLLGAGIYKWPAELSAEIAGKAMAAFRDKYGNELQINLYVRLEDLKNGLTEEKLNVAINKGGESFQPPKIEQSKAPKAEQSKTRFENVAEIQQFANMINTYQDKENILKPLATKLLQIFNSNLPLMTKLSEANFHLENALARAGRTTDANLDLALFTISDAREVKEKVPNKKGRNVDYESNVIKEDAHGREQHEYRKQQEKVETKLPSIKELKESPLRTAYIAVKYIEDPETTPADRAFNKLTQKTLLHYFESASKIQRDLLPTTTDPSAGVEWAEQMQDDIIRENGTEKVIVASIQVPEILFQTVDNDVNAEQANYLDTNLLKQLVATEEGKSLLKVNQADFHDKFDVAKEQAQQIPPTVPQPVKIDGVKQAKLNFLNSFMDKFNALPASHNNTLIKEQMVRDLKKYTQSTDADIQSNATRVLSSYNQQQGISTVNTPPSPNRDVDLSGINVQRMYDQERSTSIDRNQTLNAFARNAVKRIANTKNADRDRQIAGIQVLVDNVNSAKDPETKDMATRDLVFAVQYVQNVIKSNKKTNFVSALDIVCDKIQASIPKKDSYNTYQDAGRPYSQGEVNSMGKTALDKVAPIKDIESKSKGRPSH
jgi:O-acetyl-ADP-ribose deacetylase (regulator of RNase III)